MSATVTPIHARRAGHAIVSEGTHSARRILNPQRTSLTPDPYLLRCTERLHQVDARQLPAHVDGAAVGHCRTDQPADHQDQAHPADDQQGHGLDHLQAEHTVSARAARWLRRLFNR